MDAHVPIRRARPDEADRLSRIALEAKRHWGYPEPWIEAWADSLTLTPQFVSANLVFAAAGPAGTPVAFYALVGASGDIQLDHLWVIPEC